MNIFNLEKRRYLEHYWIRWRLKGYIHRPSSNGKSIEIAMTVLFNNNYQSLFQLRKDNQDAFVKRHGIKMGFMSAFVKEHHTFKYHYLYINLACLSVCLFVLIYIVRGIVVICNILTPAEPKYTKHICSENTNIKCLIIPVELSWAENFRMMDIKINA